MFDELRENWEIFKSGPPGERFQCVHKRRARKNKGASFRRWAWLILGILLILAGIFFLAMPGPGMLVLAVGLALVAGESLSVARILDWAELKLRPLYLWGKRRWRSAGPALRWTVITIASAAGLAAALGTYLFFQR
jgi:hypothetical protein